MGPLHLSELLLVLINQKYSIELGVVELCLVTTINFRNIDLFLLKDLFQTTKYFIITTESNTQLVCRTLTLSFDEINVDPKLCEWIPNKVMNTLISSNERVTVRESVEKRVVDVTHWEIWLSLWDIQV